ncbi:uncharacterized protein LOC135193962 [Vanessa tameamea]|uniref:Uncharacterized protein LOC135193962 n=1 Tax=Vanessa tameamea TaxID=334116 RepID=A0ABM4ATM9_VANTA
MDRFRPIYRTVSWTAATLLASDPPWELQAEALAEVYRFRVEASSSGDCPGLVEVKRVRALAQRALIRRWEEDLGSPSAGLATVEAIRPHLSRWVKQRRGTLSFRLMQVLTGHGCFGRYLHRIARREMTPSCHECGAPSDTARHTLIKCSAWGPQRHSLAAIVGRDLSLPSVINAMIDSERCWKEMVLFCENVMTQKEAAERERENSTADPLRRRRRRLRYGQLLLPP